MVYLGLTVKMAGSVIVIVSNVLDGNYKPVSNTNNPRNGPLSQYAGVIGFFLIIWSIGSFLWNASRMFKYLSKICYEEANKSPCACCSKDGACTCCGKLLKFSFLNDKLKMVVSICIVGIALAFNIQSLVATKWFSDTARTLTIVGVVLDAVTLSIEIGYGCALYICCSDESEDSDTNGPGKPPAVI